MPPDPGAPFANLTQPMSSTDYEPAPSAASEAEPGPRPGSSLRQMPRRYLALGLIVVAIFLLGTLVLVRDHYAPSSSPTTETFNPAPSSLLDTLHSVPQSVYDTVGVSSPANPITPLRPTTGSGNAPMWLAAVNGGQPEPVIFFYGAEYAPYAAAQRWPLVLALSRFGSFRQVGLMQSSTTTAFANVATFTFYDSVLHEPLRDPRAGRALQLPRTRRGPRIWACRFPTRASARRSAATHRARRRSHCSTWPTGGC